MIRQEPERKGKCHLTTFQFKVIKKSQKYVQFPVSTVFFGIIVNRPFD